MMGSGPWRMMAAYHPQMLLIIRLKAQSAVHLIKPTLNSWVSIKQFLDEHFQFLGTQVFITLFPRYVVQGSLFFLISVYPYL